MNWSGLTNKMEHFSFKNGYAVRVKNSKMCCQLPLQPKKTKVRKAVLAIYVVAKDILPALHY